MTMSASRPMSASVALISSTPSGTIERAAATGADHGAAAREHAAHRLDRERDRASLAHTVPGVEEPEHLVAVVTLGLAHDGADHGVEPGAVASAGEHADPHPGEDMRRAILRASDLIGSPRWPGTRLDRCRGGA